MQNPHISLLSIDNPPDISLTLNMMHNILSATHNEVNGKIIEKFLDITHMIFRREHELIKNV